MNTKPGVHLGAPLLVSHKLQDTADNDHTDRIPTLGQRYSCKTTPNVHCLPNNTPFKHLLMSLVDAEQYE